MPALDRIGPFLAIGGLCAACSFGVFQGLLLAGVHYLPANAAAWAAGAALGFVLNRRYTFGIRDRAGLAGQAALVTAGSLGQLLISSVGAWLLIGLLGLPPAAAFVINLAATSSFMFLFMSRVAFRTGGGLRAGAVIGRLRAMSPSAETVLRRARRFAAVGGLCTLLAFVVFDQLTRGGMHVAPANACTWALSVGLGFVLNRRVTFSIRDRAAVGRHALRYVTGSAAQLAASSLLLTALVDGLGWPPRGAWLATLALMAGLMFAYLNLFAFTAAPGRSPAAPRPAPG